VRELGGEAGSGVGDGGGALSFEEDADVLKRVGGEEEGMCEAPEVAHAVGEGKGGREGHELNKAEASVMIFRREGGREGGREGRKGRVRIIPFFILRRLKIKSPPGISLL